MYDSTTGKREAHVSAIKVSAPVRACGLSKDCRHVVAAIGKGFVFRFEYLGEDTQVDSEDALLDENANVNISTEEGEQTIETAAEVAVAEGEGAGLEVAPMDP